LKAYKEANEIFSIEEYGLYFAKTKHDMGDVYMKLAGSEDRKANIQKALECFSEAIRIYTNEDYPLIHEEIIKKMENIKK